MRYICYYLDYKVVEITHIKTHKFSCVGGTIQNLNTSSLNFKCMDIHRQSHSEGLLM